MDKDLAVAERTAGREAHAHANDEGQGAKGAFLQLKEIMLGDEQRELGHLREQLAANRGLIAELQKNLSEKARQLAGLRDRISHQEEQLGGLRGEFTTSNEHLGGVDERVAGQGLDLASLGEKEEQSRVDRELLRNELGKQGEKLAALREDLDRAERQDTTLREELGKQEGQLAELAGGLEEQGEKIRALRDDASRAQEERGTLRKDLAGQEERQAGLDSRVGEQATAIEALKEEAGRAREERGALQTELGSQGERLAELRGGLKGTGAEVTELREGLAGQEERQAGLNGRVGEQATAIEALKEEAGRAREERGALQTKLGSQGERLAELRGGLEGTGAEVTELREGLAGQGSQLEALRSGLDQAEQAAGAQRAAGEEAVRNLQEALASKQEELDGIRERIEAEESNLEMVRECVDQIQARSVERLSQELIPALRQRELDGREAFDELVAAMQPGTISAIQRSVSTDKQPLTKALFPIMGPAIRNYVMDLFRGMVEELNRTIQNATSAERIRWRAQAKLAGKPYSEYVLLKTRSFQVEEVYLMQRETGLLLQHVALNPTDDAHGEADLVSGMFTAIRSFVKDSFAGNGSADGEDRDEEELDRFTFGEREVLIEVGPSLVLAAVVHGVPAPSVRDELKRILEQLHAEMEPLLARFSGDTDELEGSRPTLRQALIEHRAESEEGSGGGMWRAWAVLGALVLGAAVWIFFSIREQRHWDRFETALRAEPGVAVTGVEKSGWKRHREVRGMRDPLAVDPAALAGDHGINLERTSFQFGLMESREEQFEAPRAAAEAGEREELLEQLRSLQGELEALRSAQTQADAEAAARSARATESLVRSLFSEIPGLEIEFAGESIKLRGDLGADELALVQARVAPLRELRSVDTSGLSNDTGRRIAALLQEIAAASIPFRGGTLDPEDMGRIDQVGALLRELHEAAAKAGASYSFTVVAHPLIGSSREANRLVEDRRAQQVRARLVAGGVDASVLGTGLSEDLSRAGEGVTVKVVEGATER